MPYAYLDHIADVGLQATAPTFEMALQDAAQGLLDLMVDTSTISGCDRLQISATAGDPAALLVSFLNTILAEQDIRRRFFKSVEVTEVSHESDDSWTVWATLVGEKIDLRKHDVQNEVKAATYSGLKAELTEGQVQLQCVLDI